MQAVAQSSFAKTVAETCDVINARKQAEVASRYNANDSQLASLVTETSRALGVRRDAERAINLASLVPPQASIAEMMAKTLTGAEAQLQAGMDSHYNATDVLRTSFADNTTLALKQSLQGVSHWAMSDTTASLKAMLTTLPTGIETTLAGLRDITSSYKASIDPLAAYGPFVHIRPEPPLWDIWRDRGRDYSWNDPDDSEDEIDENLHGYYEQTESGLYVPKGGRPPGPSLLTKSYFLELIETHVQVNHYFPSMERFVAFLGEEHNISISVSSIQRYCREWRLCWRSLRRAAMN